MASSPFHGIFQSLGISQGTTLPTSSTAESTFTQKTASGQVAADIYEQGEYYIIKIPLAGVRLTDLDIEVAETTITIRGCRKQSDDVSADRYLVQECFWGEFSRSITLPCSVDPKKIKASFNKECILKILIPKEEHSVKVVRINEG